MTRKKTFNFGKVDYLNHGRKDCAVEVTIELKDTNDGPEFTASGNIWNARHTDIYSGGQNLDTIARFVNGPTFKKIYRLWTLYHLNGMHPECEHQRALGWRELAGEEVTSYAFDMNDETRAKVKAAKARAIDCLKAGETFTPTPEETRLVNLPERLVLAIDELSDDDAAMYKPGKFLSGWGHEKKERRGWIRNEDDERGILGRPCPVCGYKYGTSWLYAEIPADDLQQIRDLLSE